MKQNMKHIKELIKEDLILDKSELKYTKNIIEDIENCVDNINDEIDLKILKRNLYILIERLKISLS